MEALEQKDLPLAEAEGQYAEARALWVERLLHGPVEGLIRALEVALCAIGADVYAASVAWAVFRLSDCGRGLVRLRVDELAYTHLRCSEAQVGRALKRCCGLVRAQKRAGMRRPNRYAIDWPAVYDRAIGRRSVPQTERSVPQTERSVPQTERELSGPPAASNPEPEVKDRGLPIPEPEVKDRGLPIPEPEVKDRGLPIPEPEKGFPMRMPSRTRGCASNEPKEESSALITPMRSPKETKETKEFIGGPARSNAQEETGVAAIAELLPAVLDRRASPWREALAANRQFRAAERKRIKRETCLACGLPAGDDWWLAGKAADLVVLFGFPVDAKEDPEDNLAMLLGEVRRRRGSDGDNHIANAGAWLCQAVKRRAEKAGMALGRRKT